MRAQGAPAGEVAAAGTLQALRRLKARWAHSSEQLEAALGVAPARAGWLVPLVCVWSIFIFLLALTPDPTLEPMALGLALLLALPMLLAGPGKSAQAGSYGLGACFLLWGVESWGEVHGGEAPLVYLLVLSGLLALVCAEAPRRWTALAIYLAGPLPLLWIYIQTGTSPEALFRTATPLMIGGTGLVVAFLRGRERRLGRALRARLRAELRVDPLTGILSRMGILAEAKGCLDQGSLALLYIDVDHFKAVNDTYGHATGDRLLRALGAMIEARLPPGCLAGRLGGEELVVLLPEGSLGEGEALAEALRRAPQEGRGGQGDLPRFTLSVGVAVGARGASLDRLLGRADRALYEAKGSGRDRVVVAAGVLEADGRPMAPGSGGCEGSGLPPVPPRELLEAELVRRSFFSLRWVTVIGAVVCLSVALALGAVNGWGGAEPAFWGVTGIFSLWSALVLRSAYAATRPWLFLVLGPVAFHILMPVFLLNRPEASLAGILVCVAGPWVLALLVPLPAYVGLDLLSGLVALAFLSTRTQGLGLSPNAVMAIGVVSALGVLVHAHLGGIRRFQILEDEAALAHLASHDGLSGLLNRATFLRRAEEAGPGALIALDLDHFKAINDTHGHDVGDRVLAAVGRALKGGAPEDALLGRTGGEELAIYLPRGDRPRAHLVAEGLRLSLQNLSILTPGGGIRVTGSFGIALGSGGAALDALCARADAALYAAKAAGRNRVVVAEAPPRRGSEGEQPPWSGPAPGDPERSAPL